jgi:PadR family transcriptional regulator PadR
MERQPRMTGPTRGVLEIFLSEPLTDRYGLELGSALGLPSGTIHPILARLEGVGWLASGWEDVDPSVAGRPARRYYRLTSQGQAAAAQALARAAATRERLLIRLRPVEG